MRPASADRIEKANPTERRGRKVSGLRGSGPTTAGLPNSPLAPQTAFSAPSLRSAAGSIRREPADSGDACRKPTFEGATMAWSMRKVLRTLAAAASILAYCSAVPAADSAGMVKTMTGSASVMRDGETLALATGQRVYAGDRVAARDASYVGITLNDDTRLTIGPGSELQIREFAFDPATHSGNSVMV